MNSIFDIIFKKSESKKITKNNELVKFVLYAQIMNSRDFFQSKYSGLLVYIILLVENEQPLINVFI